MEATLEVNPETVRQGEPVTFDLTVRNAIGRVDTIWDYDNDGTPDARGSRNTIYSYENPGAYMASVIVKDQVPTSVRVTSEKPLQVYNDSLICGDAICSPYEDPLTCPADCPTTFCSNGKDDDRDGLIDLADPDCENAQDASEFSLEYFDAVLNPGEKYHLFDGWYLSVSSDGNYYRLYNNSRPTYESTDISDMIQQHIDEAESEIQNCRGVEGFSPDGL